MTMDLATMLRNRAMAKFLAVRVFTMHGWGSVGDGGRPAVTLNDVPFPALEEYIRTYKTLSMFLAPATISRVTILDGIVPGLIAQLQTACSTVNIAAVTANFKEAVDNHALVTLLGFFPRLTELRLCISTVNPHTDDSDDAEIRILLLETHIVPMIRNASVLGESTVWDNFLKGINSNIFKFCNAKSKLEFTYALYARRCGYYGPNGEFLINSTIVRMLSKNKHNLGNEFDDYDETSNLIDLKDFIAFILTPYVAALLIAEDRTIALSDAHDICDASSEFGDVMQPLDDSDEDVIDDLHRENIKAQKGFTNAFFSQAPPRYRKIVQNVAPILVEKEKSTPQPKPRSKSVKKTLSLTDFNEPQPKTKPKQSAAKKTRTKSSVNPNTVSSSYGTRSKSRIK
ncbi:hypothetical protein DFH06DRAFT_1472524 [Mycena polygramma]|nr:hypothetical protein DFH06DRAFT_1472524 [Mycena polygramma]